MCEVAVFIVMIVLCIFIGVVIGVYLCQLAAPRIMNRLLKEFYAEDKSPDETIYESSHCLRCKHFNDMDYCPNCNGDDWEPKE